jgi:hypothetical protein
MANLIEFFSFAPVLMGKAHPWIPGTRESGLSRASFEL